MQVSVKDGGGNEVWHINSLGFAAFYSPVAWVKAFLVEPNRQSLATKPDVDQTKPAPQPRPYPQQWVWRRGTIYKMHQAHA